jgi:hypothetical protein
MKGRKFSISGSFSSMSDKRAVSNLHTCGDCGCAVGRNAKRCYDCAHAHQEKLRKERYRVRQAEMVAKREEKKRQEKEKLKELLSREPVVLTREEASMIASKLGLELAG